MAKIIGTATIFVDEVKYDVGDEDCFGVRFNTEWLPKRSCVVGFVVLYEGGSTKEIILEPQMKENQKEAWEHALELARFRKAIDMDDHGLFLNQII